MSISYYSVLSAILWCNIFMICITSLRKQTKFIVHFSIMPLLIFIGISVLRLCFVFELPHTITLESSHIFPAIVLFLTSPTFALGGHTISLLHILIGIWIIGTVFFIGKYAGEARWLRQFIRTTTASQNTAAYSVMEGIVADSKRRSDFLLLESEYITTPLVFGLFRPTIILPDLPFTQEELHYILKHEWTHFLHKDAWVKVTLCFLCALFWWNPFAHILKADMNRILELRCDNKVVSAFSEKEKLGYLKSITKIIRYQMQMGQTDSLSTASVLVYAKEQSCVEERFQFVLESNRGIKNGKPLASIFYLGILGLFLISNVFILQPAFLNPADYDFEECYSLSPANAYMLNNHNGTYSLYADDVFRGFLEEQELIKEPFITLAIK